MYLDQIQLRFLHFSIALGAEIPIASDPFIMRRRLHDPTNILQKIK
ncbi:hypothetical protein MtrunA17_Chr1g0187931 [Medicago truncatula]|uniref:Uncharacterized protein n=1 Tax=Medicago truncatula TaxID=3880 RepID=A0A396JT07_MEDTR|nr:hypothetical protein MtrunA17_Chr1g0187931 [Medicago truncatula]